MLEYPAYTGSLPAYTCTTISKCDWKSGDKDAYWLHERLMVC